MEGPLFPSILVVNKFPEVFLDDFPGVYPMWKLFFGIDLVWDTRSITIPSYRMSLIKLKEINKELKNLHDKGFIYTSVSPWVYPIFTFLKRMVPFEYASIAIN